MSTTRPSFTNVFNHVTIIGGGLMGSGIAQVTAQSGIDVTVIEVNEDAIKKSDTNIKNSIQRVAKKLFQNSSDEAEKYIAESMGRLKISLDLNETVSKTDLVVEAIVENMGAKHQLFSKIDSIAPEHTIFASNTSSLPITDIAAVTKRKDRFGGLHFFNPVPVMKLLEVVRTKDTSDDTYQKMMAWGKAIGKTTITCNDTPGFVVNRLLIPYLAEAARMLERGDATAKDIDVAMKLGAGYPMGPLELLDYVGLDTTKFILDGWHNKYPDNPAFAPINILQRLVSEGKLGKKSGEGFYTYKKSTGVSPFIHSPFFQPLPSSPKSDSQVISTHETSTSSPAQHSPETSVKTVPRSEKMKKVKFDRSQVQQIQHKETASDAHHVAKMDRLEKLKKLDKLKALERWKNSEEFIKYERDKPPTPKKNIRPRRPKPVDYYINRDTFKTVEKSKNLEDFIRFEREKDFRLLNTAE
ncbi:hypothetical protein RUM43_001966 [Polyplax serrata]|uniref:Hydroxyacyl-coenzyme A dehydrogenase, mitochondrial n=1 Tax=Polyplax serrata TaxID=468196 RepID=A0AAN8NSK3_POLSC